MIPAKAQTIIDQLGLQPHPEGGFYRETYRAEESLSTDALSERYGADRNVSTAIYYLLIPGTFSEIHRLKSDEIFHFYAGDPVEMIHLFEDGRSEHIIIGPDIAQNQQPQVMVPRNVWQGSRLQEGGEFALLGCTVAPGFDFQDYESGQREELMRIYPKEKEWIRALTRARA